VPPLLRRSDEKRWGAATDWKWAVVEAEVTTLNSEPEPVPEPAAAVQTPLETRP